MVRSHKERTVLMYDRPADNKKTTLLGGFSCYGDPERTSFAFSFLIRNENRGVATVETGSKQQSTGLAGILSRIIFTLATIR